MAVISGLDRAAAGGRARSPVGGAWLVPVAGAALLWPALYNGFPLIFSDTGTYVSQAMELHLGWDRPPFYSFLVMALGWGRTLWPPTLAQCLLVGWLIDKTRRVVAPEAGTVAGAAIFIVLVAATALPWTAAQIMPDIFTPMMVLAFAVLVLAPGLGRFEILALMAAIGTAILVHLSNLPIYAGLCLAVLASCALPRRRLRWAALLLPFALGLAGLSGVNLIASGRLSPSPYGATFVLARLLSDGPARATLARNCATERWRLCAYRGDLPRSADGFLWRADSPLYRAGGPERLIRQTRAIVVRTVEAEPGRVLRDAGADFARQLVTFAPGSGLRPWRATAGRAISRDFPPATVARFAASRQARGLLAVFPWLAALDRAVAVLGMAATAAYVLAEAVATRHRRLAAPRLFAFSAIVLLALLGNAAVTGTLSGPHDRYQSRVVWLAVLSGSMIARALYARPSRPTSSTT